MYTNRRVLIVDNDDDVLCAFDTLWREAGYETVTTWSGIEALRFLRSSNFNALFVDDYIADMHVGEFLKRASQLLGRSQIFVMQTAPTEKSVRFEGSVGSWSLVDKTNVTDVIRGVGSGDTNARSDL
jgi:CheY-like chemotaxis protein